MSGSLHRSTTGSFDRSTTARDEVLARIRSALGPDPTVPEVPREYRGVGAPGGDDDLLDLLVDRLEDYRATVMRVTEDGIPAAIDRALGDATRVVVPSGLPEAWEPVDRQVVRDTDLSAADLDTIDAVVTASAVTIADTGTIVLDGSADQGRRAITLVPDLHVCVVRSHQVVASVPAGLDRLDPSRPQTWISGPSATSDIELNRVEGVHGPRNLVVLLVSALEHDPVVAL